MKKLFSPLSERRRQSLLALAVFALLATAFLNRALLPSYTLLPLDLIQFIAPWDHLELGPLANPLISDPFYIFYPNRYLLTTTIMSGRIPLWNPYILSGTPTIADPNFQPFYLPNLLAALILPVQHALPWLAWGQLILTGWLMYGFLGQQRLHWLARILGSGTWMLNGYIVVWLENPHRLSTLAWLPGIFWAYQKAVDERRLKYAAIGGLLFGLSILGGQVQFMFAASLVMGVYAASRMVWQGYRQGQWSPKPLLPLFLVGIIGVGAGAIMLIPAGEFAAFSQRFRYTAESILRTRLPWQHIATLIAPDFFGNPVNPEGYWGQLPNYAELAAYFGVISLLLALTAPFVARRRQFAFAALVSLLFVLALVLGTPLVRTLFLFPGAQFIALRRLLFLVPLCGAWLAAIALDGWLTAPKPRRWALIPALLTLVMVTVIVLWAQRVRPELHPATYADLARSAVLLLLATGLLLYLSRRPRLLGSVLVLLALIDLWQWGWDFNPVVSTTYLYPENEVVAYLRQDTVPYRVLPLQSERLIFGPNVPGVFGIQTIGGYSSLIQGDYFNLYKAISDQVDFAWLASSPNKLAMSVFEPEVSLMNVKYILAAKPLPNQEMLQQDRLGCDAVAPLTDDWTTQTFTATAPGLNRIDLLLASELSAQSATEVEVQLWRDGIGSELVANETISPSTETPSAHTIYFAPVSDSAGQTFVLGVRGDENAQICTVEPDQTLAFNAYGTRLISLGEKEGVWIYENATSLPRAYLVHHAETRPADRLLDRLLDEDFDFYHSVLLADPLPAGQRERLASWPLRPQGTAEIIHYDLHRVDLNVTTSQAAILVLTDTTYPGWQVIVNGAEQDILEVNSVYRGVFLPAGTHSVSFQFRPSTLYLGASLTLITVVLAMAIYWFPRLRRKQYSVHPEMVAHNRDDITGS